MYLTTTFLTSLFALGVVGAPQAAVGGGPDACGPTNQGATASTDPKDTCFPTEPSEVTAPSAFGILGIKDSVKEINMDWAACEDGINRLCDIMADPGSDLVPDGPQFNFWHFDSDRKVHDQGASHCKMGYWLPGEPQVAPVPSADQCKNVFASMKDSAQKAGNWFAASVNLKAYPGKDITADPPSEFVPYAVGGLDMSGNRLQDPTFELPNGVGTGEAVTPWYPSYILMIDSDDPLLPSKNTPETPTPSK